MSIDRCKHCQEYYDQDYNVEHESECEKNVCIECDGEKEILRWNRCRSCNQSFRDRTNASLEGNDDGIDQDRLAQ